MHISRDEANCPGKQYVGALIEKSRCSVDFVWQQDASTVIDKPATW
jgi:hypothetical protein